MSDREQLEAKIAQCRRFLEGSIDALTAERLRAMLAELEERRVTFEMKSQSSVKGL